jgi:nicotinamide riboside kinase
MKIAVVGSHFVGKTTLCKNLYSYLTKKGFKVAVLDEIVRKCPFTVNEMATIRAQDWILDNQIKEEQKLENDGNYDFIITDRGTIDNFAYWRRAAEKSNMAPEKIIEKQDEIFAHAKSYDLILFLSIFQGNIENDNFRSTDDKWRKEMHERVEKVLERFSYDHDIPIIRLRGNEKEVFKQAIERIEQLAPKKEEKSETEEKLDIHDI